MHVSLSRTRSRCPPFSGLLVTIVVIASVQSIEHAALDFGLLGGALGRASLALESRLHGGRHFILHVGGLPFHLRTLRTHALVCLWIEISSVAQGTIRQNFTAERWATEKGAFFCDAHLLDLCLARLALGLPSEVAPSGAAGDDARDGRSDLADELFDTIDSNGDGEIVSRATAHHPPPCDAASECMR